MSKVFESLAGRGEGGVLKKISEAFLSRGCYATHARKKTQPLALLARIQPFKEKKMQHWKTFCWRCRKYYLSTCMNEKCRQHCKCENGALLNFLKKTSLYVALGALIIGGGYTYTHEIRAAESSSAETAEPTLRNLYDAQAIRTQDLEVLVSKYAALVDYHKNRSR